MKRIWVDYNDIENRDQIVTLDWTNVAIQDYVQTYDSDGTTCNAMVLNFEGRGLIRLVLHRWTFKYA